ncbi:hypothetical protein [uncultured Chitinophaga sp.]|jgi:Protein of unknown function (DUF2874).|uniref:hypothetical protein n=1 Tax=uncultured Chitinophaga sp. TaxID=339340 RepID=UPI002614D55D|nr:hypothetical protein [uncultured Chitinophaga sp.]
MIRHSFNRIILTVAFTVLATFQVAAAPGESLLRLFSHTFPDAKYVRWTEEEGYYIVSFTRNDTQCRIWYDKEGSLVYSLKYCQETELPMKVLLAVKKRFHHQQIAGVTELTNKSGVHYELVLSDEKKWYVVNSTAYGDVTLKYSFSK